MKNKLACVALCMGAALLIGCGGGDDDDDDDDVTPMIDAAPPETQCDPVNQTGCDEGEKCAQLVVSIGPPFLGRTDCVPAGTVELGQACGYGDPGDATGFDDCVAGAQCINGLCRPICQTLPDSCPENFSCSLFQDLFDDIEEVDVGVCNQVCNPVLQDCALEGEACYFNIADQEGQATCVGVVDGVDTLTQGQTCNGPNEMTCYLNGCAPGYWAQVQIFDIQPAKGPCEAFCQPVDTYIVDPDGDGIGDLVKGGNPEGFPIEDDKDPKTPPLNCNAARIGVAAQQCRFFQRLGFIGVPNLDYIPAEYGFCTDTGPGTSSVELWGKCESFSLERYAKVFDDAEAKRAGTGNAALNAFCTENPAQCTIGCISLATEDMLVTAYCKANPDAANCAKSEARARFNEFNRKRAERALRSLQVK